MRIRVEATALARVIAFPVPMDYGEGPLLARTLRLGHGETISTGPI